MYKEKHSDMGMERCVFSIILECVLCLIKVYNNK
nr:MAG TPA: hypothetical protein [Caudoviricetes sp.]